MLYGVEGFLVNFENREGVGPFEMYFDDSLYGVKCFGCLSVPSIPTLGFGDGVVNDGFVLCHEPFGVNSLELGHEADGSVFGDGGSSCLIGQHCDPATRHINNFSGLSSGASRGSLHRGCKF